MRRVSSATTPTAAAARCRPARRRSCLRHRASAMIRSAILPHRRRSPCSARLPRPSRLLAGNRSQRHATRHRGQPRVGGWMTILGTWVAAFLVTGIACSRTRPDPDLGTGPSVCSGTRPPAADPWDHTAGPAGLDRPGGKGERCGNARACVLPLTCVDFSTHEGRWSTCELRCDAKTRCPNNQNCYANVGDGPSHVCE